MLHVTHKKMQETNWKLSGFVANENGPQTLVEFNKKTKIFVKLCVKINCNVR